MEWPDLRERRIRVPDRVVFREMAQETVLLDIDTGRYHGVDRIGARFFEVMRSGVPLARAASTLADEYRQPIGRIEQDLTAFSETLLALELIELEP